jgi:hypothetical protein
VSGYCYPFGKAGNNFSGETLGIEGGFIFKADAGRNCIYTENKSRKIISSTKSTKNAKQIKILY